MYFVRFLPFIFCADISLITVKQYKVFFFDCVFCWNEKKATFSKSKEKILSAFKLWKFLCFPFTVTIDILRCDFLVFLFNYMYLINTMQSLKSLDKDIYSPTTYFNKKYLLVRMLGDAGGYNGWPKARGIFFNDNKTFLCWINEEDHLRFISMQKGGDVGEVYKRLVSVSALELHISSQKGCKR